MRRTITCTCFIALFCFNHCSLFDIIERQNNENCVSKIISENLKDSDTVYIAETQNSLNIYSLFNSSHSRNIIVLKNNEKRNIQKKPGYHNYVILLRTLDVTIPIFALFEELDKQSRYIIIVSSSSTKLQDVQKTFLGLFNFGIVNVLIFMEDELQVYSWDPYSSESKCGQEVNLVKTSCTNQAALKTKPRTNLDECHLNIVQIENPPFVIRSEDDSELGIFQYLLNTVEDVSGIRMRYNKSRAFEKEYRTNGTYYGLINYLHNEKADAGIGKLFINDSKTVPLDLGPAFYKDDLVFVTRHRRKLQTYTKLLNIFTSTFWIVFFIAFAIVSTAIILIGRKLNEPVDCVKLNFEMYRTVVGTASVLNFNRHSLRVLFFFYCLYCINLDAFYIARLSSTLTTPNEEGDIDHVNALIKLHIKIIISWDVERLTFTTYYANMTEAQRRGLFLSNHSDYELLKHVALIQENGTVAFISSLETYVNEASLTERFEWDFNTTLYPVYFLRKTNALNDVINFWSKELIEKGFIKKWWADIVCMYQKKSKYPSKSKSTRNVVLTVAHCQQTFYLLLFGLSVASVVFILENIVNGFLKRQNKCTKPGVENQ